MSIDEITEKLDAFVREKFDIDDDPDYSTDVNLFDYGYVDSIGATYILCFVEDTFKVEISQRDITLYPMNTVREIAEIISKKL